MVKKKKKTSKQMPKKKIRLAQATNWLLTYNGKKVVRGYRKKFGVDITCALRELQEIGYEFPPGYVDALLKSEAARIEHRMEQRRAKEEQQRLTEEYHDWQDDRFYYIAGYTSGGAPYGVTWEEMGLRPYEDMEYL